MKRRMFALGLTLTTGCLIAQGQVETSAISEPSLSREAAAEIVRRLDAASDAAKYDALFDPLHTHVHSVRVAWMGRALGEKGAVKSKLLDFGIVGDRGVVLIESVFQPADVTIRSTRYVAFRRDQDPPIAILDVEVNRGALGEKPLSGGGHSHFGCPACNYVMEADPNWLMVPHLAERVGCLEAISFYSLTAPISVDLSVHVTRGQIEPAQLLHELVVAKTDAKHVVGEIEEWIPPHYLGDRAVRGLVGAHVEVTDSRQHVSQLHAVAFGPVTYLFTGFASRESLRSHQPAINALLSTFMLRETNLAHVQRTLRPIEAHTGGSLDGLVYENAKLGLTFKGPEGFHGRMICGGHLAHVTYTCPTGRGSVSLRVLAPPPGFPFWTTESADASVSRCIEANAVEVSTDSGWSEPRDRVRDLRLRADANGVARALRLVLAKDGSVLMLLEARAADERLNGLRRCFDDLVRK